MSSKNFDLNDFGDEQPAPAIKPGGLAARAMGQQAEPDYLKGLNPEQRAADENTDGPLLVLAGAQPNRCRN